MEYKPMKSKSYDIFTMLTSLLVYLEWGGNNHSFLFQAEWAIFRQGFQDPISAIHPLIVIPILSQFSLMVNLVLPKPRKLLVISGISGLALLIYFILLVGMLSRNIKIILSTAPFLIVSTLAIKHYRQLFRHSESNAG